MQVWIAIFAILLNALAPSISHAVAASGDPASWDICRAADSNGAGKPAQPAAGMDHCGYCLAHAGSFAITAPSFDDAGLFDGYSGQPFLLYHAPQPLLALTAAPPRGPPAHS